MRKTPSITPRADLRGALAAEWTKVMSVRPTAWTLAVMAAVMPGIAVLVGATKSLQPDDTILGGSLTGAPTALLVAAIFGVLVISTDYGTGTIRTTFTAIPRRGTVLRAKALVVAGQVFVVAFFGSATCYGIGILMLSGGVFAQGDAMPALLGIAVAFAATSVLGLAVGTILRHSAGAITAVVGILLMPPLVAPLFGDLERWIAGAMPAAAVQKLGQSSDAVPDAMGSLGGWTTLVIICAYSGLALAGSAWHLRGRDV